MDVNKQESHREYDDHNEVQMSHNDMSGADNPLMSMQNRLESAMEPNHFADVVNRSVTGTQLAKHSAERTD